MTTLKEDKVFVKKHLEALETPYQEPKLHRDKASAKTWEMDKDLLAQYRANPTPELYRQCLIQNLI